MMVDVGCGGCYQLAIPEIQQDNTASKTADIKCINRSFSPKMWKRNAKDL